MGLLVAATIALLISVVLAWKPESVYRFNEWGRELFRQPGESRSNEPIARAIGLAGTAVLSVVVVVALIKVVS